MSPTLLALAANAIRRHFRLALLAAAIALALANPPSAGAAEQGDPAAKRAEFQALFQQLLKDPTNLQLNLRYARLGAEIGDYEASISALERLLLYNPDLPSARLQLGLLYARLHSYAMARLYLEQAASAPNASADVRARANDALVKVASLSSPHRFAGMIEAGVQYQTDANAASGSATRPPPFFVFPGGVPLTGQHDVDFFVSAAGIYRYDLGDAEDDTLEATGTLFQSAYLRNSNFNLGIAELTLGPRFTLDRIGIAHASVRPYALGDYVLLGNSPFFGGAGGGVEVAKTFEWATLVRLYYEHEARSYWNASNHPGSTDFNGGVDIVRLQATQPIGDNSSLDVLLRYVHEQTRFGWDTNNSFRLSAEYAVRYAGGGLNPGFPGVARPWETTLRVAHDWTPYDAPNPAINHFTKRYDRSWFLSAAQYLYLTRNLAAGIEVQEQITSSSLPDFAFNNTTATFAIKYRF